MPNLRQRLESAVKAAVPYGRYGGGTWGFVSGFVYGWPRFDQLSDSPSWSKRKATFDVGESAGNPHDNSVVAICLGKIANCFSEPALQVVERQPDGTWAPVEDHPLLDQLAYPNPWDDLNSLGTAWSASYKVDGNAYLVISRARGGGIQQLDWVSPDQMEPCGSRTKLITHYVYRLDGEEIEFPAADVLHWRYSKDPSNQRLGCSRLKKLLMEIASDNEASRYTTAILHNLGVVGGVLSYTGPPPGPTGDDTEKLKERFRQEFLGAGRGGIMVPTFPSTYTEVGQSPEKMALDVIRRIPTDRICSALDVSPMVAGLAEGESYANKAQAWEEFWDGCMVPLGTRFTDGLTRYLLPLYGDDILGKRRRRVRYCYDDVRALQPDMDKISARKVREWQADGITLNQFLEAIGEPPMEEGDPRGDMRYTELQAGMKPAPPPPIAPGFSPESQGDRTALGEPDEEGRLPGERVPANERTPPFGAQSGMNGSRKTHYDSPVAHENGAGVAVKAEPDTTDQNPPLADYRQSEFVRSFGERVRARRKAAAQEPAPEDPSS